MLISVGMYNKINTVYTKSYINIQRDDNNANHYHLLYGGSEMALIGIMGGTFNPIHNGHIHIAKAAYEQFSLDEIWFMPNHIPAYKSDEELISGEDRIHMVDLAIEDFPYFLSTDFELKREGPTYSAETFSLLHEQYPEHSFFFIMGADSLFYFEKWKNPEIILRNASILVAPRDEKDEADILTKIRELNTAFDSDSFFLIGCSNIPCSSSEIRSKLHLESYRNPSNISQNADTLCVPIQVLQYIIEKSFYFIDHDS